MKLTSGCSIADEMRKRPFPEPISSTTGRSFPNSFSRSSRTNPVSRGSIAMSDTKDHAAAGDAAFRLRQLVHRYAANVDSGNLARVDDGAADAQRIRLFGLDQLETGE